MKVFDVKFIAFIILLVCVCIFTASDGFGLFAPPSSAELAATLKPVKTSDLRGREVADRKAAVEELVAYTQAETPEKLLAATKPSTVSVKNSRWEELETLEKKFCAKTKRDYPRDVVPFLVNFNSHLSRGKVPDFILSGILMSKDLNPRHVIVSAQGIDELKLLLLTAGAPAAKMANIAASAGMHDLRQALTDGLTTTTMPTDADGKPDLMGWTMTWPHGAKSQHYFHESQLSDDTKDLRRVSGQLSMNYTAALLEWLRITGLITSDEQTAILVKQ